MKIPRPITEEAYERELNRLVDRFAAKVGAKPRTLHARGIYGRVYRVISESTAPLTASEAFKAAGIDLPRSRSGPLLEDLKRLGWVSVAGHKEKRWVAGHGGAVTRSVRTFVANEAPLRNRQLDHGLLIRAFNSSVNRLNVGRFATRCLALRIEAGISAPARGKRGRNVEIVRRRLAGEELRDIAKDYGISWQTVQAIIVREIKRGDKKIVKDQKGELS